MDYALAYEKISSRLIASADGKDHWRGELSASALSTAVAVSALFLTNDTAHKELAENGLKWLAENQNKDGGWGDTIKSRSNLPTTLLVDAAFTLSGNISKYEKCLKGSSAYLSNKAGKSIEERIAGLYKIYGKDKTFVVPILVNLALAGKVSWEKIPLLPFEIAILPFTFYRMIGLPVVSYALPALISMGQVVHHKRNSKNILKTMARPFTLKKLGYIQPESGGYLEAIPLTAFVVMSLIPVYGCEHPVVIKGLRFLKDTVKKDGSWAIDSDLSQWLTTQAVQALAVSGKELKGAKEWIAGNQTKRRHKYTDSAFGAWGWSDLSGSVPDADDTSSALIALYNTENKGSLEAAKKGVKWLLDIQNGDGGFPTFCRGWTELPFDKSTADITAHALRALALWKGRTDQEARIEKALKRGLEYLRKTQDNDGSWSPLWFGNEQALGSSNKVYGTARVLAMYRDLKLTANTEAQKGMKYLLTSQDEDGGWGGAKGIQSSFEETALAVIGLAGYTGESLARTAFFRGAEYLTGRIIREDYEPAPIGLYFQSLWYFERLYPLVWGTAAMGEVLNAQAGS